MIKWKKGDEPNWNLVWFASVVSLITLAFLLFSGKIIGLIEYRWFLFCAYSGGMMPESFYHQPPAYDLEKLPVIEMSLTSSQKGRLVDVIKSNDLRDRIINRINRVPKTKSEIRVRSYLLHLLAGNFPGPDLLDPLKESLKSTDESVYGWACSDLDRLIQKGFIDALGIEDLKRLQDLLDDTNSSRLKGSNYADSSILGKTDFPVARRAAHKAVVDRIAEIERKTGSK